MNLEVRIVNKKDKDFKEIKKIYKQSFLKEERIIMPYLFYLCKKENASFWAYYIDNNLCGMSYILTDNDFAFIFYLAIKEEYQNQGIGSKIIDSIKKVFNNKTITINCLISKKELFLKRKKFYKKNGFIDTNYILSDKNNKYNVYANNRVLAFGKYKDFLKKLSLGVYNLDLTKKTSLESKE